LIGLPIVHLQGRKERVLEADIDSDDMVDDRVRFVGFEGRGDGEVGSRV
jgi:hypothetical protein